MTNKNFNTIAKEQFNFLESQYNLKLSQYQEEDWGYEFIYTNDVVGVKITYEYREAYIFIMLYRLVDGSLQENPTNIDNNTVLNGYGLDDIIKIRNPKDIIKPAYEYGEKSEYYDKDEGLSLYISAFATNLRTYAQDILSGNFELYHELDKIVKKRLKKHKKN